MKEAPGVVASGCNSHHTAAAVSISAKIKNKKKNKAGDRSESKLQLTARSETNGQDKVVAGKVIKEKTQIAAETRRPWSSRMNGIKTSFHSRIQANFVLQERK